MKTFNPNIKNLLRRTKNFIIGRSEDFSFDHRFFNSILFSAVIIAFYTAIVNILLKLNTWMIALSIFAVIIFLTFYWITRFKRILVISRWFTLITLFGILSFAWFYNAGSKGPTVFLFFVFFSYILLILDGFAKKFFIVFMMVELTLLFILEYFYPKAIVNYESDILRLMDIYASLVIYFILGALIIIYARRNYTREKEKAKKSDLLKTSFLANMSHEIRTPMNSIIGFSQLLRRENITPDKKERYLKIIVDNGNYLLRIINDIIDISKIESEQMKIILKDTDINKMFGNLYLTFRKLLDDNGKNKVDLKYYIPDGELIIKADQTRVEQILSNLLFNAVKFTHKGEISFGCSVEKENILFYVRDTGIGIKKEDIDLIFERFRKAEDENQEVLFRGTGLGLSISSSLVEMMNGKIWVKSKIGEGSEFYFTLPANSLKFSCIENKLKVQYQKTHNWKDKKILIAEDDETNFYMMQEYLEPTQIRIFHAKNGKEAIDMAINYPIDMVLMDIMLPEINGYEATGIIKMKKSSLPIIAQTACAMKGDEENCLKAGCDDYIAKPINGEMLLQKLSRFLD